jgi:hypothetical protein
MGFLTPLLGVVAEAATLKTGIEAVAPHFFGGASAVSTSSVSTLAPYTAPSMSESGAGVPLGASDGIVPASYSITGMAPTMGGLARVFPAIESVVPKSILRATGYAGIALAIYEEYKRWRGAGHSHKRAKRAAHQRAGIHLRRRRINPYNPRALRRAVRRLKSFRRGIRKVRGVLPGRGAVMHGGFHRPRRARPRRGDLLWEMGQGQMGDLYDPELYADEYDEVEDLGYEPEDYFPGDGE